VSSEITRTAFDASQRELGCEFMDWESWLWPNHFGDPVAEHRAVRAGAGIWDESPLRKWDFPGQLRERVEVGDRGELGLLGAEADVAVVPVDEEVGRRAVDELVSRRRDVLPLRRHDALAVDVARDGDLLEEDVLDPALVDQLAELADPLEPLGIVSSLLQGRERIGDLTFREHALDLGRT